MGWKKIAWLVAMGVVLMVPGVLRADSWTSPAALSALNSSARDLEAFITADGQTLYFASDRGSPITNREGIDLYVSHWLGSQWSTPEKLSGPINDPTHWDGHPSVTLDGRYLYFHSTRPGVYGMRDLWVSENINGQWQTPVNLGPNVNSSATDCNPSISADGQTLIFASDRAGSLGDLDLYVTHKVDGVWQPAENLSSLNTNKNDTHPSFSYTGRYLFFASSRQSAPFDVYRSEKIAGVYQPPLNLGPPINTGSDDIASFYSDCTETLFVSSMSLPGGSGSWDIGVSSWIDPPHDNPCQKLIIPEGQWRVRVTLLEASAALNNSIYIDQPISQLLIKRSLKNVGKVVATPFLSAEELIFHIHVNAQSMGLGEYDHYSNSEFAHIERTDPLRYIVGFEDLPADQADWDFNDTVLLVELVGEEVNIQEDQNYLGEAQLVEAAPLGQDTSLGVPLTKGVALDAAVTIPGSGLTQSTYSILTEGEPGLYTELLDQAPFQATGDIVKLELTDGQARLQNGQAAAVTFGYSDLDNDGLVDGTSLDETRLYVYQIDLDTLEWTQLPTIVDGDLNTVSAEATDLSLFALGGPLPVVPVPDPTNSGPAANPGSFDLGRGFGCSINAAPGGSAGHSWLLLLLAPAGLASYRILRRREQ